MQDVLSGWIVPVFARNVKKGAGYLFPLFFVDSGAVHDNIDKMKLQV